MKHFNGIDIFFIIMISIYFITLFLIISIVISNYLFNPKVKKELPRKLEENLYQCNLRKILNYEANVSYVKNI